jgi:hypothetical protein
MDLVLLSRPESGERQQWPQHLDGITYNLLTSGDMSCDCFPKTGPLFLRNSICVRGHFFPLHSLSRRFRHGWLLKCILIPRSICVICSGYFSYCRALVKVLFEGNTQLKAIEEGGFRSCYLLRSISLPASVKVLGRDCFAYCECLSTIQFSHESSLTDIKEGVFAEDFRLKSICLPASLQRFDISALLKNGLTSITVEEGNPFFFVEDAFLMTVSDPSIVRYFGSCPEILITSEIQTLCKFCFSSCHFISSVVFESGLVHIGESAFLDCSSLKAICIPSTVAVLGAASFRNCTLLSRVTFESGIGLEEIGEWAFSWCRSLREIQIPASVRRLCRYCFANCASLVGIQFECGSRLERIESFAFPSLRNLVSISLPAGIQTLDQDWLPGPYRRMVMFESGESLRRMTRTRKFDVNSWIELFVPVNDRELIYCGYVVRDFPEMPGFVSLVKTGSLR